MDLNDSQWRQLDLPHDWSIEGEFSEKAPAGTGFIRAPYFREIFTPLGVIYDTFETAITWDRFEEFHAMVMETARQAVYANLPGRDALTDGLVDALYHWGPRQRRQPGELHRVKHAEPDTVTVERRSCLPIHRQ